MNLNDCTIFLIIVIVMVVFYNYLLPQLILDQFGDKMFEQKNPRVRKLCVEVRG
jgi:hypothetical protein